MLAHWLQNLVDLSKLGKEVKLSEQQKRDAMVDFKSEVERARKINGTKRAFK